MKSIETFDAVTSLCDIGTTAQTKNNGRQNGTFSASISTNN